MNNICIYAELVYLFQKSSKWNVAATSHLDRHVNGKMKPINRDSISPWRTLPDHDKNETNAIAPLLHLVIFFPIIEFDVFTYLIIL